MKALTVAQPYAHLISLAEKRVENRTWPTRFRGRMYIHAGKSRDWLFDGDLARYPRMAFGAIVAVVTLVDCVTPGPAAFQKYPWLESHMHTSGPWCWILERVVPVGPWLYRGMPGLFEVPDRDLDAVANRELGLCPALL